MESLGDTILRVASEPLSSASVEIAGGRVSEGIARLTREALLDALARAVIETARRAGVIAERIEALLPHHDIELAAALVDSCRAEVSPASPAETAPAPIAGKSQGGLEAQLDRLALAAGEARRGPLELLVAALGSWLDVLRRSKAAVDADQRLRTAYRLRWLRIGAIAATAAATIAWLGARHLSTLSARRRVEAAISGADVCAADAVFGGDLARATDAQRRRWAERHRQCTDARAAVARAERHREGCLALATNVDRAQLGPEDEALLEAKLPLARRVVERRLSPEDLALDERDFDCGCPEVAPRLWVAFAKAAASSTSAWAEAVEVSEAVKRSVTVGSTTPLSDDAKRALHERAEAAAERSVTLGDPEAMARAAWICELYRSVSLQPGQWCRGLASVLARQHR